MKAIKVLTICFIILSPLFIWADKSSLKFHSLEYPKEILIKNNFIKNINIKYYIYYTFNGIELVKINEKYDCFESWTTPYVNGNAYFISNDRKILPKAFNYFRSNLEGHYFKFEPEKGYKFQNIFSIDKPNKIELNLLSPEIYSETEIAESIENKTLSKIVIYIKSVRISWHLSLESHIKSGNPFYMGPKSVYSEKEGDLEFNVNKKIEIRVKYEK